MFFEYFFLTREHELAFLVQFFFARDDVEIIIGGKLQVRPF